MTRRGQGTMPFVAMLFLAVAAAQRQAQSAGFTVCFAPPRLTPPSDEVRARVAAFTDDPRVRAIFTHESGGDPHAVSPTGCAGLGAICGSGGLPACCAQDDADDFRTVYDLCNSEVKTGFHCDFNADKRFSPEFAANYVKGELKILDRRMARPKYKQARAREGLVMAMAYNAGLGAFAKAPAGFDSVAGVMAQFDLQRKPYAAWDVEAKVNKIVEIYDYMNWYPYLASYWKEGKADAVEPAPKLLCFDSGARGTERFRSYALGSAEEKRIRKTFSPMTIRRLSFGKYEPADVLFRASAP